MYQVPCKNCCKLYMGESIRTLKVRLAERTRAVQKIDANNGIAVNVADTNHSSAWANAKVAKKILRYWERITTEAILINKSQKSMNFGQWPLTPWSLQLYFTEHTLIATPT